MVNDGRVWLLCCGRKLRQEGPRGRGRKVIIGDRSSWGTNGLLSVEEIAWFVDECEYHIIGPSHMPTLPMLPHFLKIINNKYNALTLLINGKGFASSMCTLVQHEWITMAEWWIYLEQDKSFIIQEQTFATPYPTHHIIAT